jgi:formylglycine-generating enzyme required for sulfatase activity
MKRIIIILIIALFVFSTLQAQSKKVVILEPLGSFTVIQKAILRAKIAEALTCSGNYETFIDTYIDHDLNCSIQLIGEEEQLLVECNLTELKNGKVITSINQHIVSNPVTEFEQDCIQLAAKLAWWSSIGKTAQTYNNTNFRNGESYNLDGIELIYVESSDTGNVVTQNFFIGKLEITQAQWRAIMGNNFSHFTGDNLPVENVNWWDVKDFLVKLNMVTGRNYRLPTETEWEFAARGGTVGKGYMYSGSENIDHVAWYNANSGNAILKKKYENGKRIRYTENIDKCTHPAGIKAPNELGIYDMTGNVWEWCNDWYDTSQQEKVVRGCGWDNNALHCYISMRAKIFSSHRDSRLGFRVALSF